MIRDVVQHAGLELYPIVGLVLFVLVFVGVSIRAIRMRRAEVDHISHLPLSDGLDSCEVPS